jgi:hypothetical protein
VQQAVAADVLDERVLVAVAVVAVLDVVIVEPRSGAGA